MRKGGRSKNEAQKKPMLIEAVKFEKDHIGRMQDFCDKLKYNPHDNEYYIETLEGCMKVSEDDYIVKVVNGEFYPCKADIIYKTYKLASEEEEVQGGEADRKIF